MKKRTKDYTQMTAQELREATREFDVEHIRAPGKPLTRAQRARFEAARRKGGRPIQGEGARVISLSVERGLLRSADAAARRQGVSRAQFFAQAVLDKLHRQSA